MVRYLPDAFLKNGIDVANWNMEEPMVADAAQFHPLQFQRMFAMPDAFLSAAGWSQSQAKLIGATISYYFSLWVSEQSNESLMHFSLLQVGRSMRTKWME